MSLSILLNRSKFFIIKNSPKILTALGIAAYGASVLTTVKSARKYEERVADDLNHLRELKDSLKDKEAINAGDIVVKDVRKDMLKTELHAIGTTLKVYAPTLILFATGTTCILSANSILYKRQAALAAAYGTLNSTFAKYRERVAEKYGSEEERAIRQGAEVVKDKKTGDVSYKQTEEVAPCSWDVIYDETCTPWQQNQNLAVQASYLEYIRAQLQQKLEDNGYLFLEDVYKALGVNMLTLDERVLQGCKVVGWLFDAEKHPTFLDFGLKDHLGNKTDNYYKCIRDGRNCFYIQLNPEGDILTGNDGRPTFMAYLKKKN